MVIVISRSFHASKWAFLYIDNKANLVKIKKACQLIWQTHFQFYAWFLFFPHPQPPFLRRRLLTVRFVSLLFTTCWLFELFRFLFIFTTPLLKESIYHFMIFVLRCSGRTHQFTVLLRSIAGWLMLIQRWPGLWLWALILEDIIHTQHKWLPYSRLLCTNGSLIAPRSSI